MKTGYELIKANGLTLHGDIEYFAELVRADERRRIKPEFKPDIVTECKILGAYKSIMWNSITNTVPNANIKLTFDGETGKLKSAEVI